MRCVTLAHEEDFAGWREAARTLASAAVPPARIVWQVGDRRQDLFAGEAISDAPAGTFLLVPKPFLALAQTVICHSDPERFGLLYAVLLRLQRHRRALEDRADPLVRRLEDMRKSVGRDMHKMRAFLRFREVPSTAPDALASPAAASEAQTTRYVAWFEPDHHIVRMNAPFFQRRFAGMNWSILTPGLCAHWNGATLSFSPGMTKADAPDGDPLEEMWKTYFGSVFNPARVNVKAMTAEMPKKYWENMPETALVPNLIAGARACEAAMVETARSGMAKAGDNRAKSLTALAEEAEGCRRCPLWKPATQLVFGEGPVDAALMLVGEQPGDREDLAGRPFVGPAGAVLDRALGAAGIDRAQTYVTNAVKHFKFELRGKRRIHTKPKAQEIEACRWWIDQERALVAPKVIVALGATAARCLLGKAVTISKLRGAPLDLGDGSEAWATVHPSYLLRLPDESAREEEFARFVHDLKLAGTRAAELS